VKGRQVDYAHLDAYGNEGKKGGVFMNGKPSSGENSARNERGEEFGGMSGLPHFSNGSTNGLRLLIEPTRANGNYSPNLLRKEEGGSIWGRGEGIA